MRTTSIMMLCLILLFNLIHSQIKNVPQDYSTIQEAINAAVDSDTILVSEGTYYENINFRGKSIVVASNYIFNNDPQTIFNTIIDGSKFTNLDSASVVSLLSGEDSNTVLEGFTITGGKGTSFQFPGAQRLAREGGGIILDSSFAKIRNNIIIKNKVIITSGVLAGGGGGISICHGNPEITNNLIISNEAGYAAGLILNYCSGIIRNNIICNNSGGQNFGTGGVMVWRTLPGTVFIENNTIIGNYSSQDAGGVSVTQGDNPVIKNNIIWGNRQEDGGQITRSQYFDYNTIEDFENETNISEQPLFESKTLNLLSNSPGIDAGDTAAVYNDIEDSNNTGKALFPSHNSLRNDIGSTGGPFAKILPSLELQNIYVQKSAKVLFGNVGDEKAFKIEILNQSSTSIVIDSVTNVYKDQIILNSDFTGKTLDIFIPDSIEILYTPKTVGSFTDTLKVYHSVDGLDNPLLVTIEMNNVAVTDLEEGQSLNNEFKLFQNYPNPFNPSTTIKYSVPQAGIVTLKVFNAIGQEIVSLVNEYKPAGNHSLEFDSRSYAGKELSSGVYFYNIRVGKFTDTKKLLFIK